MRTVKGDLIQMAKDGRFDVIVHGCNCFCEMGAGIAKAIRRAFPRAFEADRKTEAGSREKLGDITFAEVPLPSGRLIVVNAYTQYHWSGRGVLVDYEAFGSTMRKIKEHFSGKKIGYPKIGAGLRGLGRHLQDHRRRAGRRGSRSGRPSLRLKPRPVFSSCPLCRFE